MKFYKKLEKKKKMNIIQDKDKSLKKSFLLLLELIQLLSLVESETPEIRIEIAFLSNIYSKLFIRTIIKEAIMP